MNNEEKEEYIAYLKGRKSSSKVNYYLLSQKEIATIRQEFTDRKPRILIHACCAVCASWPLEMLAEIFDVTVYYNNSNIWPTAEYERRRDELVRYIEETNPAIELIIPAYDNEAYTKMLEPRKDDPEGWKRCFFCYAYRMDEAYRYAAEHGYDYFTTIMSISRQKDSQKMNEIGRDLSAKYPAVRYFYSDFKKGGGQVRQKELVDAHQLYRQDYCGCIYSYQSRHTDTEEV